jgi:hypothetical protein
LLFTPRPRIPSFISNPKKIGGCIDGGHDSAAGPNSSRDNDGSAPCSLHNHSIGNNSMTYVEWDAECKCASVWFLPCFLPFVIFGLCLTTISFSVYQPLII